MPTCVGHAARSALSELGESLNKLPAVVCESFAPTVQFKNLKYIQYSGVFKLSFVTKSFAPPFGNLIRASLVRIFADQLILAYCLYYKPSETQMCDENVNFSTLALRVLKFLLLYINIPLQWSTSCWMICAVQPVKVLIRVWNCSFCH